MASVGISDAIEFEDDVSSLGEGSVAGDDVTVAAAEAEAAAAAISDTESVTSLDSFIMLDSAKPLALSMSPWIQCTKDTLTVQPADHLLNHPNHNCLAIFGGARTGKSFLLNCLCGTEEMAETSANMAQPCTADVQIGARAIPLPLLGAIDTDSEFAFSTEEFTTDDMFVTPLDVEGQGDRGEQHDVALLVSVLLTTKAVVYNWRGGLEKNTILNRLGMLVKAAEAVVAEGESDSSSSSSSSSPLFGHLNIVLRDWPTSADQQEVTRALLHSEPEVDTEAKLRNTIRRSLQQHFKDILIWLLPSPRVESSDDGSKIQFAQRSPEFMRELCKLRQSLCVQLLEPMEFNGVKLSGAGRAHLVPELARQLNSSKAIRPESAFLSMIKTQSKRLVQQARDEFVAETAQLLKEDPPLPCDHVESALSDLALQLASRLSDKLLHLVDHAFELVAPIIDDFEREMATRTDEAVKDNMHRMQQVVTKRVGQVQTTLLADIEAKIQPNLPFSADAIESVATAMRKDTLHQLREELAELTPDESRIDAHAAAMVQAVQATINTLAAQSATLKEQQRASQEQREAKLKQMQLQCDNDIANARLEAATTLNKLTQAQQQEKLLQEQLAKAENQLRVLDESRTQSELAKTGLEDDNEKQAAEVASLSAQLARQTEACAGLSSELQECYQTIEQLRTTTEALQSELAVLVEKAAIIPTLRADLDTSEERLQAAMAKQADQDLEVQGLMVVRAELIAELEQLQKKMVHVTRQHEQIEHEMPAKMLNIEGEITSLKRENDQLAKQRDALAAHADEVEVRLAQCEVRMQNAHEEDAEEVKLVQAKLERAVERHHAIEARFALELEELKAEWGSREDAIGARHTLEIADLTAELDNRNTQTSKMNQQLCQLEQALMEKEAALQRELEMCKKEKTELSAAEGNRLQTAELELELEELNARLAADDEERQAIVKDMEQLMEVLAVERQQKQGLLDEVSEAKNAVQSRDAQICEMRRIMHQLQDELAKHQHQQQQRQQYDEAGDFEEGETERKLKATERALAYSHERTSAANRTISSEVADLQVALALAHKRLGEARSEAEHVRAQLAVYEEEVLGDMRSGGQEQAQRKEALAKEAQASARCQRQMQKLKTKNMALHEELQRMQVVAADYEQQVRELVDEIGSKPSKAKHTASAQHKIEVAALRAELLHVQGQLKKQMHESGKERLSMHKATSDAETSVQEALLEAQTNLDHQQVLRQQLERENAKLAEQLHREQATNHNLSETKDDLEAQLKFCMWDLKLAKTKKDKKASSGGSGAAAAASVGTKPTRKTAVTNASL